MKRNWKTVVLVLIGLIVLYSLFFTSTPVAQYKTGTLSHGELTQTIDFTSSWYPTGYATVQIGAQNNIRKINVKEGQHVNKGDTLVQLVDDQQYNQFKSAQASYWAAIKARNEAKKSPLTPSSTLATMQGQISAAYYQMKTAEVAVNNQKIKAPMSGRVITVFTGDYDISSSLSASALTGAASSSSNYITIANDKKPTFSITLSERDIINVSTKQKVTVNSRLQELGYSGTITRVIRTPMTSTTSDEASYPVEITLSSYPKVPYGSKIEGSIITAQNMNTAYLPYDVVTIETVGQGSVLVLENGQQVKKEVQTGIVTDNDVEIKSGLTDNDQVIVDILPNKKVITLRPWIKNLFTKR